MSHRLDRALAPKRAFPEPGHNHRRCTADALHAAERLCDEKNVRLTEIRKRVLKAIWSSHKPIGAYDVLKSLGSGEGGLTITTVYRAIDFLMEQGLVHRIASLNAFVGCAQPEAQHVPHFLICNECGTAAEFGTRSAGRVLPKAAQSAGFTVQSEIVELTGVCTHCRDA